MSSASDTPCRVTLSSAPSPDKRVRYSLGMLLGVADFEQEQAWFLEQDREHARALHGCGVVCGLGVSVDGVHLKVGRGLAIDGLGRVIRVGSEQCADLDAWLAVPANRKPLGAAGAKTLHVALRYCECATDPRPVPGQPCRSEAESQAASRITASFALDLTASAPACPEEALIQRFGRWLRRLHVGSGTPALDRARIDAELKDLADLGKPEASGDLFLPAVQAEALLRHVLAAWTQTVRPAPCAGSDGGVLLASLSFTLKDDDTAADVVLLPVDPPVLLSTRTLQEALLRLAAQLASIQPGQTVAAMDFGLAGAAGTATDYSRADHVHSLPALPPIPAAGATVAALDFGVTGTAGNSGDFSRADHVHAMPPAPAVPAAGSGFTALSFGTTGGAGTATDYARADHTHTLPPAPAVPAAAGSVAALAYGGAGAAGSSANFSRADHVHPLPPLPELSGDFVSRPPDLPDYAIVAAGIVCSGDAQGPVFNGMKADSPGDGRLLVTFKGYRPPSAKFNLLVKALPMTHKEFQALTVALAGFEAEGFVLEVLSQGKPLPQQALKLVFVNVEVSRYLAA